MFSIEMLPAAEGDCLWIEYGHPDRPFRVLVDGGPARTYHSLRARILGLPRESRRFELVVVTHIDADHIDGIIRLLRDDDLGVEIGDLWFNGYPQLFPADTQGPAEGEILGMLLDEGEVPWNAAFDGEAVVIDDHGTPPEVSFQGGMTAKVLGPTWAELDRLRDTWDKTLVAENWVSGDADRALEELEHRSRLKRPPPLEDIPLLDVLGDTDEFESDSSTANGASIVVVLRDENGTSCLLTGDAHAPILAKSLGKINDGDPLEVKAFKLPHHGSAKNLNDELAELVDADHYLFSSSGAKYGHPDEATINRILRAHTGRSKARLHFNYRSSFSEAWADPDFQKERRFVSAFPSGNRVEL